MFITHKFLADLKKISVLILVLILSLGFGPAMAGKCPYPGHKNCTDDGGSDSDFIQTKSPNWVIWGSGRVADGELLDWAEGLPYETDYHEITGSPNAYPMPRLCAGSDDEPISEPNPQGGMAYVCHQDPDFLYGKGDNPWNVVYMDLSFLAGTDLLEKSGKNLDLCNRLLAAPGVVIAPKRNDQPIEGDPYPGLTAEDDDPPDFGRLYSYYLSMDSTWNEGPCISGKEDEDGFCYVKIAINGNFYNECNENETKCRRYVNVEAWGHVEPNPGDDPRNEGKIEINPFTKDQEIPIEELAVYFRGIGSNKVVASCYYDNRLTDGQGNFTGYREPIEFRTFCIGTTCYQAP